MKRILFLMAVFALCLFLLAGCGCDHAWQEAGCTAPKTCTKCQQVEGEALGHSWQEATCTAPKTCSVCTLTEGEPLAHNWVEVSCAVPKHCSLCALTEGEALPHTWQEANYQRPQSCTVCAAQEGLPLPADFEVNGLVCNMEADTQYPYRSCTDSNASLPVTGTAMVSDYRIFQSDDTHAAKEGYEWRSVQVTVAFDAENAIDHGMRLNVWIENYYDVDEWKKSICLGDYADMTYSVNYLGEEQQVYCVIENYYWTGWVDDVNTFSQTMYFQVPEGFDGIVIAILDASSLPKNASNHKNTPVSEVADENSLFFRLA